MIKPQYCSLVLKFFHWYIPFLLRRDFHRVTIHGKSLNFPHAVLVISNHFSWWDAFILFYLNDKTFKKRYNVMMLEEQLRRHRLFRYGGTYSVKKKSKGIIESLDFTSGLLNDPENLVLLFPQGMIQSQHLTDLRFEKGLAYVMRHATSTYHLVFTTSLTDYFSNRKPSLHIFYEVFPAGKECDPAVIEKGYNTFYTTCKLWLINQHKE
ncbi:MAG: lysophospholipid acyltransferase family protein [Chitinophagales bacterium]